MLKELLKRVKCLGKLFQILIAHIELPMIANYVQKFNFTSIQIVPLQPFITWNMISVVIKRIFAEEVRHICIWLRIQNEIPFTSA